MGVKMKQEITKSIEEAEKELREKQIEKIINEMANEVCPNNSSELCASGRCSKLWECPFDIQTIEILAKKGYRKQVEAEWIDVYGNKYANHRYQCSNCKNDALLTTEMNELLSVRMVQALTPYCPHCSAKMKGAER